MKNPVRDELLLFDVCCLTVEKHDYRRKIRNNSNISNVSINVKVLSRYYTIFLLRVSFQTHFCPVFVSPPEYPLPFVQQEG